MAKKAATEGWTVRMTEERVAKLLAKARKGPLNAAGKTPPSQQYGYNGFRCALVRDEVVISGRNFKRTKDLVRQFVAEYQSALDCFPRDIDGASAEQPTAAAADLIKQAAEVEAAGQPLKDLLSFFKKPKPSG